MENNEVVQTTKLKDKIKEIENLDEITLANTIELMNSNDYKARFIAEWMQLKIRYNNLRKMLIKLEAGTLEFKPKCSNIVLMNQKNFMEQYMKQLEIRAEIEGITLPNI